MNDIAPEIHGFPLPAEKLHIYYYVLSILNRLQILESYFTVMEKWLIKIFQRTRGIIPKGAVESVLPEGQRFF